MIFFDNLNKVDKETLELFKTCRNNFPGNKKTCKKQLSGMIKDCKPHFFKVYYDNNFIGCLFFDRWNDEFLNVGGFSKRGKHKENIQALKLACDRYKKEYKKKIKIISDIKPARILALRAGFKKVSERELVYEG